MFDLLLFNVDCLYTFNVYIYIYINLTKTLILKCEEVIDEISCECRVYESVDEIGLSLVLSHESSEIRTHGVKGICI